jgi:hypothetical protein
MTAHTPSPSSQAARLERWLVGPRLWLASVVVFTVLTAAVTWPQVRHLKDGVADAGDPLLNTWALAWVAHQLPYAPAHIFDGNIFHPERRTLAYSETLLAPGLLGAPLHWLGVGPIAVYNVFFFFAFVFSGVGVAAVVHDLTGRKDAALVAGTAFAFLPFRFDHYSHFQLLQTQWMPLALWCLHRMMRDGRARHGVGLGVAVGLQALTSAYNAIFLGTFLAVVGAVLLVCHGLSRRTIQLTVAAVIVAAALSAPVAVAHVRAREVVGERGRGEVTGYSAQLSDYLAAVPWNRVHGARAERFGAIERRLFPGVVVVVLAVVALWPPLSGPRVAYAVGLLFAVEMSRGFNGWLYPWLYEHTLVLRSLRVPARMGLVVGLALAVLAGFGVARLTSRLRPVRALVLTTALMAGVLVDSWVAPMGLTLIANDVPEVYADLMRHRGLSTEVSVVRRAGDPPPVVLLELPFSTEVPTYMLYSTYHWQTLVNGYSGFFSAQSFYKADVLKTFPDERSLSLLGTLSVRYLAVHGEFMTPGDYAHLTGQLDRMAPEFRLVSRRPWKGREISLYVFSPAPTR